MVLLQNKRVQKYVFFFYYYYVFLPGWLISDDKTCVFVSPVATSCWLPFLQIPSGTAAGETHQSQPVPVTFRECISQNSHLLLCSPPFSLSSFAPTAPCPAILPPKQIDWDDSCRRSMFLYPGHTYCSPYPFFIAHLAQFLPLVVLFELLSQGWLHFM